MEKERVCCYRVVMRQDIWIQDKKVCTGVLRSSQDLKCSMDQEQSVTNEAYLLCIDKKGHNLMEFREAAALPLANMQETDISVAELAHRSPHTDP